MNTQIGEVIATYRKQALFRILWSMQSGYWGNGFHKELEEVIEENAGNPQVTSQIITNEGTAYLSLVKGFPIFMMVYQFIHARQCYYNFISQRTKPFFS